MTAEVENTIPEQTALPAVEKSKPVEKPKPLNLTQKLCKIMLDLQPIEKTGQVAFGNTKYKYVKAEVLFATLQKKLAAAGVMVVPQMDKAEPTPNDPKTALVTMGFTIINADDPTQSIFCPWLSQGPGGDDKSMNKAGTSGMKYFLMKLFLLSDEEDPDAETQEMRDAAEAKRQKTQATRTQPARATSTPMTIPKMREMIEEMLKTDTDAVGRMPKALADMSEEELVKTISWLTRRANALTQTNGES